ncbi:hypothetical protein PFISCL1PPCAC_5528, partial [Pristionchus fissidentatus]
IFLIEMSGNAVRTLHGKSLEDVVDIMCRMHSQEDEHVQSLAQHIRTLVTANPGDNGEGLRTPLVDLLCKVAQCTLLFVCDANKMKLLLTARMLAVATMKLPGLDIASLTAFEDTGRSELDAWMQPILMDLLKKDAETEGVQHLQQGVAAADLLQQLQLSATDDVVIVESIAPPINNKTIKRRKTLPAKLKESKPKTNLAAEKVFPSTKCEYCDVDVGVNYADRINHTWKKHKNHAYKFAHDYNLCTKEGCDYIAKSAHARSIHEAKGHDDETIVPAFEDTAKCAYCDEWIETIDKLKKHLLVCKYRSDDRACLRCSSCPNSSFYFIFEFILHAKKHGGANHGTLQMIYNE